MPLWKVYHSAGAFSPEEKQALAKDITALYAARLPAFYVGVVFQEVAPDSFFVGGEPADNFVRIWIDHIARTLPTPEARRGMVKRADEVLAPYVRDKGLNWEFHIDETPFDLWSIQGFAPPPPNSEAEQRWKRENRATAYEPEGAKASG
jgi:phenylpyruvate tautomerase PptA (4-oxalocrotonate tautomerase family)